MPKPFDATLEHLIETYPADWVAQPGVTAEALTPYNSLASFVNRKAAAS